MGVNKPYYLTVRQFDDGKYTEGGRSGYIEHPKYSHMPLQKDLLNLFEYIEPAKLTGNAYSFRTYELLLRVCAEIEANCKSILKANKYTLKQEEDWVMSDYFKINGSHFLSRYLVSMPFWDGTGRERQPFKEWGNESFHQLSWYGAYNKIKHDRANNLRLASFHNVVNAFCGLVVVLTSQFLDNDFMQRAKNLTDEGPNDGYEDAIGGYFRVKLPDDIPLGARYDFDWQSLKKNRNPFQKFDYDSL